jgi:hypothetical protein
MHVFESATGRIVRRFEMKSGGGALSDDGRTYAVAGRTVQLIEVASGKVRAEVAGTDWTVKCVALAPDGRSIATATDTQVKVWDIATPFLPADTVPENLWQDLASMDAEVGYRAVRGLMIQPAAALKLARIIPPARLPDLELVKVRITALGSPLFDVRETAMKELLMLADRIGPELRRAEAETDSEECRQRIGQILTLSSTPDSESLRQVRMVEVIERLALTGDVEAAKLLRLWSAGAEGPLLTLEAKAAVTRLP